MEYISVQDKDLSIQSKEVRWTIKRNKNYMFYIDQIYYRKKIKKDREDWECKK